MVIVACPAGFCCIDLKPSTLHALKGLKISYFGCSKRLVSSRLLLCWSQQAEGWVMGGWEHEGPRLLLTGPVLHGHPTPKKFVHDLEGSDGVGLFPRLGQASACWAFASHFPAAVGVQMAAGPRCSLWGRQGSFYVQSLPSPPMGAGWWSGSSNTTSQSAWL